MYSFTLIIIAIILERTDNKICYNKCRYNDTYNCCQTIL